MSPWLCRAHRLAATMALALAFFTMGSGPSAQAGNTWPTTEFKVVHRHPPMHSFPNLEQVINEWMAEDEKFAAERSMADAAWARLIEGYLHDAALRFQKAGFEAPTLQIVPDFADGRRPKYVVYLGNFEDALWITLDDDKKFMLKASGFYTSHWARDYIAIDKPTFAASPASRIDLQDSGTYNAARLYKTLAHELFHGIQRTYQKRFGFLDFNNEIQRLRSLTDGMADGAAMYILNQRLPGFLETMARTEKDTGQYEYVLGFLTNDASTDEISPYETSSFWFHLAERFGTASQQFGGLSVLEYLMRQRTGPEPTQEDLLRWLDGGLERYTKVTLNRRNGEKLYSAFPHFLTEFASYGGRRFKRLQERGLLSKVFADCATLSKLTPGASVASHRLNEYLNEVGGKCIRVEWEGFAKEMALEVEVEHSDEALLDQLHLGLAASSYTGRSCWEIVSREGGDRRQSCLFEKPEVLSGSQPGTSVRSWKLPARGYGEKGDALFVLANVALQADETKDASPDSLEIRTGFRRIEDRTGTLRAPPAGVPLKVGLPDAADYMLLRQYGINPDPPLEQTIGGNPLGATFAPIAVPKHAGPDAIDTARYVVTPDPGRPLPLGYTGPLYGSVLDMSPPTSASAPQEGFAGALSLLGLGGGSPGAGATGQLGTAGSMFCASNEGKPIGHVRKYDKGTLEIDIQTDICRFGLQPGSTQIERLDLTAVLPFGWRYQQPEPRSVVTPGVQYYVERFRDRLEGRLDRFWPFGGPETGPTPGAAAPGAESEGGGEAAGKTFTQSCDCTCAGAKAFQELSARRDPAAKAEMQTMMPCMKTCMSRWVPCMRPQ